mgnify:CR=1 FL=1
MIALGCDHGGYDLMQAVIAYLDREGIAYKNLGCENNHDSVDYPDYGRKVVKAILSGECEKGIVICGTGIGISIPATGIRESARRSAATASARKLPESIMTQTFWLWAAVSWVRGWQ